MGPKQQQKISTKTAQKKKEKIVEDKTFGLKNKKGAKQQKYIQQVEANASKQVGKSAKELARLQEEKERRKLEKAARQEELKTLFKPVVEQRPVPKGADPKSIICAFYKQGICAKGDKCKFSHDLSKERRCEKRSIYTDMRDVKEDETMENWDESQLNDAVTKKHGEANRRNATSKICKFFLEAVEKQTYGWFWDCPNGNDTCIYRHCLPEGYVLRREKKAAEAVQEEISLEDLIEKERAALFEKSGDKLTKVTLESFLMWKKRKLVARKLQSTRETQKKKNEFSQGRMAGLTGKDLFSFNPSLAIEVENDDHALEEVDYTSKGEDYEEYDGFVKDIDQNAFLSFSTIDGAIDEDLFLDEDLDLATKELGSVKLDAS